MSSLVGNVPEASPLPTAVAAGAAAGAGGAGPAPVNSGGGAPMGGARPARQERRRSRSAMKTPSLLPTDLNEDEDDDW